MKKFLKTHLIIFAVIGVYYVACIAFDITCPIKYITHMPCPTCGMTRAMLSLLRLDIKAYMEYNPMAFFMVSAVLLFIHRGVLKKKKWIDWYMIIVLSINTVVYIANLLM